MKILPRAFRVLVVLWAGSLWSLLWVAAALFHFQSDRHLAGVIAGRLFSIETYLGLAAAALALMLPGRGRFRWGFFAAAVLAMNEWILKQFMNQALAGGRALGLGFGAWHGVSAGVYLIACLSVLLLVWQEDFR
jgi:hypothetical protein